MSAETLLLTILLLPLAGAAGIIITRRSPDVREGVTLLCSALIAVLVVMLANRFMDGETFALTLIEPIPGISIAFKIEALGMLFALIAGILWLVTSIYAIGYMRGHNEQNQTRFFAAFAVSIAATMGIAFSANLFTLFLFYELLTLSTYPLVTHAGTPEAKQGGRVYLGILLGTSIALFLLGILVTWSLTGRVDFEAGGILSGHIDPAWAGLLYALFLFGIGKAAVMPFHRWLPAAMVAPTPVSALLHAVAVVKAGVFTILKVTIYIFGSDFILSNDVTGGLIWIAAATILLASMVAMTKDNLKARLAYSTVSQLSYIVLGAMLASKAGLIGASMHIAMHAFAKITLFFAAGAIFVAWHKKKVSELNGLGRAMPVTFTAFFIGTLSIIGLPPFGGMWSKWYLALGAVETTQLLLLAVLMISSLLNIIYLLPIPIRAFFSKPESGEHYTEIAEAPKSILLAMIITSTACIVLFFYPDPFYRLASLAVGGY
ncbi:MAG: monovalent cation/H+ antiporter subunit D family protein [Candidatus Thiodiazotropha taylori]|uniref:Monovalent cation/H+ antiporter subunit D family protein n=1 Tax=Candidatus Thiodiazotropha taylori TaxID=2792791 RepID=A0A9E4N769_9GAMM|nr:monovalent cation/H+ antiporter subunit D family protein [Candidatus Thiodiazotropha taylori]MCG7948743.1 monovalent cation/H+ antiporter subunit D family protein [Candidatus Thiodiazotropha taylori]MCG7955092.1 monovalent cation/H+ antiporter subunit D family protein [Candidatus Thiodiazotropha taylori]MCG8027322.1 monovalent cation/H+ antiporter subunit D family protein [Candidatus Thiodiazotropha taylori]MCG8057034.1 monovalent cation/H+ antiporter subunit D family protein [Candidatus Thi